MKFLRGFNRDLRVIGRLIFLEINWFSAKNVVERGSKHPCQILIGLFFISINVSNNKKNFGKRKINNDNLT